MAAARPTIVCITTHPVLRSMVERHGERFAKVVCLPDVAEFERRAVRLRPAALLLDETSIPTMIHDVARLRKHPAMKAMRIVTISDRLTHEDRVALHDAGANDILLTTHHTPRDIMARLQTLL
jgi:DNA-binding response OmpR family regulator